MSSNSTDYWDEFVALVGTTSDSAQGWSLEALNEELEAQGWKGKKKGEVQSHWKALQLASPLDSNRGGPDGTVVIEQIRQFWEALIDAKVDDNSILSLPPDIHFFAQQEWGSSLYVRDAYVDLVNIMKMQPSKGDGARTLVLGNPGIGKTWFLFYLLKVLLDEGKTVVYHREDFHVWYLFSPKGVQCGSPDSLAFLDEVRDKNTWYLADSAQPLQVPAQTVMVSSPQPKAYKKFKKFGGRNRFMPVWTYKEIEHCRKYLYPDSTAEAVQQRFAKWGGIPRYVLEYTDTTSQVTLEEAISQANFEEIIRYSGELNGPDDVSHKLVHLVVQHNSPNIYDNYIHKHLEMASSFVAQEIAAGFEKQKMVELTTFIRSSNINDRKAKSLRGDMFEGLAHRRLQRGGQFRIRNLKTQEESFLELKPTQWCWFVKPQDIVNANPNHYLLPLSETFCAVDAILLDPPALLQMTASTEHPIKAEGFNKLLLSVQPNKKLIFVVPHDIYKEFPLQPYHDTSNYAVQNVSTSIQAITQYVLEIPLLTIKDVPDSELLPPAPPQSTTPTPPQSTTSAPQSTRSAPPNLTMPVVLKRKLQEELVDPTELCGAKLSKSRHGRTECTKLAHSCYNHTREEQIQAKKAKLADQDDGNILPMHDD